MFKRKRFSKFIAMLLVMTMALSLLAPSLAQEAETDSVFEGKTEVNAEGQVYPFLVSNGEGVSGESTITIYSINGEDIPYVSVAQFMFLFSEFLKQQGQRFANMDYQVSKMDDNLYWFSRTDRNGNMWIDTEADTITFDDFNAFTLATDVTASVGIFELPEPKQLNLLELLKALKDVPDEEKADFIKNWSSEGENNEAETPLATAFKTINRTGKMVELKMSDYMIDLVEQDGNCLAPLQTLNDLFMGQQQFNLIFNGAAVYCLPSGAQMDLVYQAEPQEMSQKFAMFNYMELCFMLDINYGLKSEHGIDNFHTLLSENTDLIDKLTSTDSNEFDEGLASLLQTYFDDGHSAFNKRSWRSTQDPELANYIGVNTGYTLSISQLFGKARAAAFPYGLPMYQEIGNTAFVTFDEFTMMEYQNYLSMDELDPSEFILSTAVEEGQSLSAMGFGFGSNGDALQIFQESAEGEEDDEKASDGDTEEDTEKPSVDTIKLLYYAYQQITREGSPVENVVMDLSLNGGGAAEAAAFTLVWMLGRADIAILDTFTGAESIMRMTADLEFTGDFNATGKSMLDRGYNLYCLTSNNSFSCGNLLPAAFKMSERVTLIGKRTGGGSCVVLPCTSASGTVFQISGPKELSTVRNGSFYNVDEGIEPHVALTKVSSFYDREALVDMINEMK